MAQRYGQRVGHVGRLGKPAKPEFALDGPLHLVLRRTPGAGDRLLDARGTVADDR